MYRVYDKRTDETLFEANNNIDCALWMGENIDVDSEDFEHVWLEDVGLHSDQSPRHLLT